MVKYSNKKIIDVQDWDNLVQETYGKYYNFQQQDGCKPRGVVNITIPYTAYEEEEMNDSIPEEVNNEDYMGVKFDVWLARDIKQKLSNPKDQNDWSIELWWERNFYPNLQTVANDLHSKGLIEAGDYSINIDW